MATKALPCPKCKGTALGPPTERQPAGEPQVINTPSHFPYIVHCRACGWAHKLTIRDWARLPELTKA